MINQAVVINSNGDYVEPVLYYPSDVLPENWISTPVPEGLHRPKWDRELKTWTEGLTEEEITQRNSPRTY